MDVLTALNQTPWLLYSSIFLLGLCIGSFLNVVIYRVPVMMEREERAYCGELLELAQEPEQPERFDLVQPNSHCPGCGHAIKPWENIPVLSYLFLRGRCGQCDKHISLRYPIIELVTAVLSLGLGLYFGAASIQLLAALMLTWALIALTMIDVDEQLLPDIITLPLLWLGLLFNLFGTFASLPDAVIGAMAGYMSLWSVFWAFKLVTGKDGMGYGDFKLLAVLGAWLGWQALPMIILLSSVVGMVIGVALMIAQQRGKDIPMPFGPYLAVAGWIALLWGEQILSWYWNFAGLQQTP
jgi:leader peptidase (prepilin peptidase) / N-methyltransferase